MSGSASGLMSTRKPRAIHPRIAPRSKWTALSLALCGMILTYVWRVHDLFGPLRTLQAVMVITALTYLLFFSNLRIARLKKLLHHPVAKLVLGIFIWMTIMIPFGLYPGQGFEFVTSHVKNVALFVMLASIIHSVRDVQRLSLVHVAGALAYSLMYLRGGYGDSTPSPQYDRNDMSLVLVCTLPLAIVHLKHGTFWVKGMAGAAAIAIVGAVVTGGSRGGFLSLAVVLLFLGIRYKGMSRKTKAALVGCMVVTASLFAGNGYWQEMSTIFNPTEDYNWSGQSEAGRMEIWKRGIGYMLSNPIAGVGVDQFSVAEGTVSERAELQQYGVGWKWSQPHNIFVQAGAELGIVGLVMFCLLLFRSWTALGEIARRESPDGRDPPEVLLAQGFRGSLVGYVIGGFFLSQAYSVLMLTHFAMYAGLALVTSRAASSHGKVATVVNRNYAPRRRASRMAKSH